MSSDLIFSLYFEEFPLYFEKCWPLVNIALKVLTFYLVAQAIYINQIRGGANLYQFFWNTLLSS